MLSLWARLSEGDVEAYAGSLVLPPYLAHLRLAPFRLADQARNADGREPLVLTYVGEGRLEEFRLHPQEHALAMIHSVSPAVVASRLQLPQDDAQWLWDNSEAAAGMRIYFAPTSAVLGESGSRPAAQEAYVSVSRQQAFIGRPIVGAYLKAWLRRLGIDDSSAAFQFATPSAGVELAAGPIGGQYFLDDLATAEDLVRFAGLEQPLAEAREFVEIDLEGGQGDCGIFEEGVRICLASRCG